MVKISITDLHKMMHNPKDVRNISVIAHVDHGKTTLTDSLVCAAGIIPEKNAGTARYTDTRKDEQERCITIKSTMISLLHNYKDLVVQDDFTMKYNNESVLINLIDSPGHVDFTSEVSAALRVTDGAIIVVDCTKGVQAQTITVTKQALAEKIKFICFLNKFDTVISGNALTADDYEGSETAYQIINDITSNINALIETHFKEPVEGYKLNDITIDMLKDNIAFGSGKLGWALTVDAAYDFIYKSKKPDANASQEEQEKWLKKKEKTKQLFWGNHFVNIENPSLWKKKPPKGEEKKYARGFVWAIFNVVLKIRSYCSNKNYDELKKIVDDPLFVMVSDPKDLERSIMRKLFPITGVLLKMIAKKLPSPVAAQKYRCYDLSTDPTPDGLTTKAIKECDPNGPLIGFCSKVTPIGGDLRRPTLLTLCRVLSGTIRSNTKLFLMDDKFELGKTEVTKQMVAVASGVYIMIGKEIEAVNEMPCGNVIGVKGISSSMPGPGTIVEYVEKTPPMFNPVKNMRFTSVAIVGIRLSPVNPTDLADLVAAAKFIKMLDLSCRVEIDESGVTLFGVGPLQSEILAQDCEERCGKKVIKSEQIVKCAETVSGLPEKMDCLAKSPNKHNRITAQAYALSDELADFIDPATNQLASDGNYFKMNVKDKGFTLVQDPKTTVNITNDILRKILHYQSNICIDYTSGFQYMKEMQGSIVDGLLRATVAGPLCGEPVRGVQYVISDIVCHADAIHRGIQQIAPLARNLFLGVLFNSSIALCEPMYEVFLEGPPEHEANVKTEMSKLKAQLLNYEVSDDSLTVKLQYKLSMFRSLHLQPTVMTASSGTWATQLEFIGYELVDGDPWTEGTDCFTRVRNKRIENKLSDEVKTQREFVNAFLDRL